MTGWTLGAIVYFSGPIFSAGYLARLQPVETPLYGQIASAGKLMCSPGWESVSFPCGEFTPRFGLRRPSRGMSDAQVVDLLWEMNRPAVKLLSLIPEAQWGWNRWLLWPTFRTVSYSWKRDDNCRSHTLAYVKDQMDLFVCAAGTSYLPGEGGSRGDREWTMILEHDLGHVLGIPDLRGRGKYHDIMYYQADGQDRAVSSLDVAMAWAGGDLP